VLTARKNARKTNLMYFLRKKRPYSHKKSSKKVSSFVNPGAFKAIYKIFASFCEEPGFSQNVTPEGAAHYCKANLLRIN
jgi:hypothetical protein